MPHNPTHPIPNKSQKIPRAKNLAGAKGGKKERAGKIRGRKEKNGGKDREVARREVERKNKKNKKKGGGGKKAEG